MWQGFQEGGEGGDCFRVLGEEGQRQSTVQSFVIYSALGDFGFKGLHNGGAFPRIHSILKMGIC